MGTIGFEMMSWTVDTTHTADKLKLEQPNKYKGRGARRIKFYDDRKR